MNSEFPKKIVGTTSVTGTTHHFATGRFHPFTSFLLHQDSPGTVSHVTSNRVSMTSQDWNSRLRTRGVLLRCFWSEKMVTMLHFTSRRCIFQSIFFCWIVKRVPTDMSGKHLKKRILDGMCGLMVIHLKGCYWSEGDDQDGLMSGKALWNRAWICVQSFWSVQST